MQHKYAKAVQSCLTLVVTNFRFCHFALSFLSWIWVLQWTIVDMKLQMFAMIYTMLPCAGKQLTSRFLARKYFTQTHTHIDFISCKLKVRHICVSKLTMIFGLEQVGGSLIAPMALAHPLHPIDNRSRNKRRNLWVGWCVSSWWPWFPSMSSVLIYIYIYVNMYTYICAFLIWVLL